MTEQSTSWPWAKLGQNTWPIEYHPVVCHLIDVGQVAFALWRDVVREPVRKRVAAQLGLTDPADVGNWFAFWVGAHDIGKLTPCFQFRDDRQRELRGLLEGCGFDFPIGNKHHSDTGTKILADELARTGRAWARHDPSFAQKVAVSVGGHSCSGSRIWIGVMGSTSLT